MELVRVVRAGTRGGRFEVQSSPVLFASDVVAAGRGRGAVAEGRESEGDAVFGLEGLAQDAEVVTLTERFDG